MQEDKQGEFQAKEDDIDLLRSMALHFKKFMENLDIQNQPDKIQIDSFHLNAQSCVLPGNKLFEVVFEGTDFTHFNFKLQQEERYSLLENFFELSTKFDAVLSDIALLQQNEKSKCQIDTWYDCLKKVMRHHNTAEHKALEQKM